MVLARLEQEMKVEEKLLVQILGPKETRIRTKVVKKDREGRAGRGPLVDPLPPERTGNSVGKPLKRKRHSPLLPHSRVSIKHGIYNRPDSIKLSLLMSRALAGTAKAIPGQVDYQPGREWGSSASQWLPFPNLLIQ